MAEPTQQPAINYQELHKQIFGDDFTRHFYRVTSAKKVLLIRNYWTSDPNKEYTVSNDGLVVRFRPWLKSREVDVSEHNYNLPPMKFRISEDYDAFADFTYYFKVVDPVLAFKVNDNVFQLIHDTIQNALNPILLGMTFKEMVSADMSGTIRTNQNTGKVTYRASNPVFQPLYNTLSYIRTNYGVEITQFLKQRVFQSKEMSEKQARINEAKLELEAAKSEIEKRRLIQENENKLAAARTRKMTAAELGEIANFRNRLKKEGMSDEEITRMIESRYYGNGNLLNVNNVRNNNNGGFDASAYIPRNR